MDFEDMIRKKPKTLSLDKRQVGKCNLTARPEAEHKTTVEHDTSIAHDEDVCCYDSNKEECKSPLDDSMTGLSFQDTNHVTKKNLESALCKYNIDKEVTTNTKLDTMTPGKFSSSDIEDCNNKSSLENEDESELSPHMLHDLEEELERELEVKAEKSNLTAWNVKKMIKAVITDSEVMKMVDYSLHKTMEKPVYELKLTRAKTKELKGLDQNALWNIPVASPKKSDIEVLITQDLPEDSSDEEYEPQDEMSDEESKASEGILEDDGADLDVTTETISSQDCTVSHENIGQRTRSKLSLSETPLEAIEQSFMPPDITTDMYNTHCENLDWLNFLKEFMQPLDSNQPETVDDDNDPEYNVMIDEEHEAADKEELRQDRAVKVTKKELNDLMAELAEYTEMLSSDDEDGNSKVENGENIDDDNEKLTEETEAQTNLSGRFSEPQLYLLKQQLQQHVQLLLQSYLLSCGHPLADEDYAMDCRKRLEELSNLRKIWVTSLLDVLNLESSMKLINDWTAILMNPKNTDHIQRFMQGELEKVKIYKAGKTLYRPKLPEELIMCCLNSDAFLYPLMLPPGGFSDFSLSGPSRFNQYEDQLIAMGLEQFSIHFESDLENKQDLLEVVAYIRHLLVPVKTEEQIMNHIKKLLKEKNSNPVKVIFESKQAPEVKHFVAVHERLQVLYEYPDEYFPENWLHYL